MTVSLPVTVPATPATPANPAAPRTGGREAGKAATAAPGKPATPGHDNSDVTDMFAALIAALTQQMQPAAVVDQPAAVTTEQTAAVVEGTVATGELFAVPAPVAKTGEVAVELPVDAVAVPGTDVVDPDQTAVAGEGELPSAATDGAPDVPVGEVIDLDTPDVDIPDLDTPVVDTPDTDAPDTDAGEQPRGLDRAAAKRPAWAGSDAREVRPTPPSGTIPATPAQPAQGNGPATPAAPATPGGGNRSSGPLDAVSVTPPATAAPTPRVEAPATVAAPPPAPAADAHVQIARVVRPLRLGDDGAYELALDLTPAELGRVRIDVELRGATINLHLRADNPATRELLQASMDQLRAELEAAGLQAGSLDIGNRGDSDRPTHDADGAPAFGSTGDDPVAADTGDREPTTVTDTSDGINVLA